MRLAAAAALVMEGEEKIRVRVSFWEMVTWQDLIGQFGEWRIMTLSAYGWPDLKGGDCHMA